MNIPFARSERLGVCVAGWISLLLLSQPILDALSFWLGKMNHGEWVTLGLRMLLLAVTVTL